MFIDLLGEDFEDLKPVMYANDIKLGNVLCCYQCKTYIEGFSVDRDCISIDIGGDRYYKLSTDDNIEYAKRLAKIMNEVK